MHWEAHFRALVNSPSGSFLTHAVPATESPSVSESGRQATTLLMTAFLTGTTNMHRGHFALLREHVEELVLVSPAL